jgi:hypothetical protein
MSLPDALAAFAEPATTTVTILDIKTDAILDSDDGEFMQLWQKPVTSVRHTGFRFPAAISMPWRQTGHRSRRLLRSIFD